MGRPRSKDRMSRMVQARLTDDQYDWLAGYAIDFYEGDLSKAIRRAIQSAQILHQLLNSEDPRAAFDAMLKRDEEDMPPEVVEEEESRRLEPWEHEG